MDNNILFRIGNFFTLVGCGFLLLFTGTILARELNIPYLLLAAAGLFLGFVFRRAAPRPEPKRFSGIRSANARSRLRRAEKQTKKAQEK